MTTELPPSKALLNRTIGSWVFLAELLQSNNFVVYSDFELPEIFLVDRLCNLCLGFRLHEGAQNRAELYNLFVLYACIGPTWQNLPLC